MKQYFELKIKPLNDRLGASLGKKKVSVVYYSPAYEIPVKLSFISVQGTRVNTTNRHLAEVRALGVMV